MSEALLLEVFVSARAVCVSAFAETCILPMPPLTVNGSYNKALAWAGAILEYMVERLYFLVPTLPDTLGELTPNLQVGEDQKRLLGCEDVVHIRWD